MRNSLFAIAGILLGIGLTSCGSTEIVESSKISQDKIYQNYNVTQRHDSRSVRVSATFRTKDKLGPTLKLSGSSHVKVNGQEMKGYKFLGYNYKANFKAPKNGKYKFKFTDTDGKVYKNSGKVEKLELPAQVKLNPAADNKIDWIGNPLERGEKLSIYIDYF